MSDDGIRRYSIEDLREMTRRGESRTDMARLHAMSDDERECLIADDPDAMIVEPVAWGDQVQASLPRRKVVVTLRLDADVVEALFAREPGWQAQVNAILRAHLALVLRPTKQPAE